MKLAYSEYSSEINKKETNIFHIFKNYLQRVITILVRVVFKSVGKQIGSGTYKM